MMMHLEDWGRIGYWFHLAFKTKEPSDQDKETADKILRFSRACKEEEEMYADEDDSNVEE